MIMIIIIFIIMIFIFLLFFLALPHSACRQFARIDTHSHTHSHKGMPKQTPDAVGVRRIMYDSLEKKCISKCLVKKKHKLAIQLPLQSNETIQINRHSRWTNEIFDQQSTKQVQFIFIAAYEYFHLHHKWALDLYVLWNVWQSKQNIENQYSIFCDKQISFFGIHMPCRHINFSVYFPIYVNCDGSFLHFFHKKKEEKNVNFDFCTEKQHWDFEWECIMCMVWYGRAGLVNLCMSALVGWNASSFFIPSFRTTYIRLMG